MCECKFCGNKIKSLTYFECPSCGRSFTGKGGVCIICNKEFEKGTTCPYCYSKLC